MIWRGWGISVLLLWLMWMIVFAIVGHDNSLAPHGLLKAGMGLQWGVGIVCILTAASVFLLARYRKSHPRKIADPQTNATVLVSRVDDFFFIPFLWWSYILLGCAAILMVAAVLGIAIG